MRERRWYEADALMVDLTVDRCVILGYSEEEVERKMRERLPGSGGDPGAQGNGEGRGPAQVVPRKRLRRTNAIRPRGPVNSG